MCEWNEILSVVSIYYSFSEQMNTWVTAQPLLCGWPPEDTHLRTCGSRSRPLRLLFRASRYEALDRGQDRSPHRPRRCYSGQGFR